MCSGAFRGKVAIPLPETQGAEMAAFSDQLGELWRGFGEIAKAPGWTPQQDTDYVRRIAASITGYVVERLNDHPPPQAETLELELNRVTTQVFDGLPFDAMKRQNPGWQGFAHALQTFGPSTDLYAVAVTIGPGNTPWNLIEAFGSRGGKYESVASIGDDFKNRRLRIFNLRPFEPQELRFLVSGLYIGSPEGLSKVAVYSFDGQRLRMLWQDASVPNAQISFSGTNLTISSYDSVAGKRPWISTLRTYAQVDAGLRLVGVEHRTVQ